MHWNGDWHTGWMSLSWLPIIAVLALVVWYALSAARRRGERVQDSPEQVLKRHYANGEIDSETYERKLEELRK